MVPKLEEYSDEILNLKCWVAENSSVHPNKILMTALKTRPIVVSYMMRKKNCGTFLKFVESDDGQIAAWRNRVEKIIHDGKVLNIGNTLSMKVVNICLSYHYYELFVQMYFKMNFEYRKLCIILMYNYMHVLELKVVSLIAKALNGTSFIHVRLRYEKSQSKGLRNRIRNAASMIGRNLGMKMEGREVYVRNVQPENSNHGILYLT